jgi:hypothetical protein
VNAESGGPDNQELTINQGTDYEHAKVMQTFCNSSATIPAIF